MQLIETRLEGEVAGSERVGGHRWGVQRGPVREEARRVTADPPDQRGRDRGHDRVPKREPDPGIVLERHPRLSLGGVVGKADPDQLAHLVGPATGELEDQVRTHREPDERVGRVDLHAAQRPADALDVEPGRVRGSGLGRVPVPEEVDAREGEVRLQARRDLVPDHAATGHAVDQDQPRAGAPLNRVERRPQERHCLLLTRRISHRRTLLSTPGYSGEGVHSPGPQKPPDRVNGPVPISARSSP